MDRQVVSPLDLSRTLPAGGGLLVLYSLSGSPDKKSFYPGWRQSFILCLFPVLVAGHEASVGTLWPVVRVRRRPGTKGSQLRPLGPVHWQASWPLSTPSGPDVSLSEEESRQSCHLLQEGGRTPSRPRSWALV